LNTSALYLAQGRFDAALRDYKKGKFLLESRPGQLLPIGSSSSKDGQTLSAAEQQQKRILDKVWSAVERAINEMRNVLLAQLKDSGKNVEDHEKTIEYVSNKFKKSNILINYIRILLELGSSDEPIWTYFDSQYKHILEQMNVSYQSALANIRGECAS
jgi:exocyst complex component 2